MSPTDSDSASSIDDEPAFLDVLNAADGLADLPDRSRRDAWASSVLGIWAEDHRSAEIDAAFVAWLAASPDQRASAVADAVADLVDAPDGEIVATRAWVVADRDDRSVGIGFAAPDESQHSLLADVVDGELVALVVAPGPDELFDGAEDMVAPEPIEIGAAAAEMVEAWDRLAAGGSLIADSVFVNAALARSRLRHLVESDVSGFGRGRNEAAVDDGIDASERAELDAWALSVLDGAGVGPGVAGPSELVDPLVPGRIAGYPAAEREAFLALEWADWLGVVLGLVRAAPGTAVEPTVLVDLVNRCPEVTSTIPRKDRPYFEWAWSMVVPLWRAAGVLDADHTLTPDGAAHLVHALRHAWTRPT